ncbi:MAG: TlpA family protein disulfide reductase [Saprospiraceae bacterium]
MNTATEKMTIRYLLIGFISLMMTSMMFGQGQVIVAGTIKHSEYFLANITFFKDHLQQQEEFVGGILDEEEVFNVQFKIPRPSLVRLEHGNNELELYLEPGDSIYINFDNWDMEGTLEISGMKRVEQQNKYLLDIAKEMYPYLSGNNAMHFFRDLNEEEYQTHAEELKRKQERFLKTYQRETAFSSSFLNYVRCEIEYTWAASLLNYPAYHQFFNNQENPMIMSEKFYRFLRKVNYLNLYDLNSNAYRDFLDAFVNHKMENLPQAANVLHRYFYKNRIKIIHDNLNGDALNYMLAQTFISAYQRGELYELAKDVEDFLMSNALESYKDVVDSLYKIASTLRPGQIAPNFELETLDGGSMSFSDLKGKVIYVDFWATWCGPCKKEMEHSKKLKEQFRNEDVVFVYISLDDTKDKDMWQWFVRQNQIEGIHLMAKGGFNSDIAKAYNVTGVPTYYLIDKNGQIASNTPKRPSQPGLAQEIQVILEFMAD